MYNLAVRERGNGGGEEERGRRESSGPSRSSSEVRRSMGDSARGVG